MVLSTQQQSVLTKISQGENVFMTGPGGTGKSYVISEVIKLMKNTLSPKSISICALTGVAAELLECGAQTIHSWSGIGKVTLEGDKLVTKVLKNKKAKKRIKQCRLLILDEVSMMSVKFFINLEYVIRNIRNKDIPFGGLQVLFSGDFYQLPPVGDYNTTEEHSSNKHCFQCELWNKMFTKSNIIQLTTIFRQSNSLYTKILMQIRKGRISKNTHQILLKRTLPSGLNYKPTIIYPTRKKVISENKKHMDKLTSKIYTYECEEVRNSEFYLENISNEYSKFEIDRIKREMNAEQVIELKQGAHVMCIANLDMSSTNQIVNGSQGIITEIINGLPIVKFRNGITREIDYHSWMSDEISGLGVKQIPLILSWAITIHKSQGLTLDSAIIDAGMSNFTYGQVYVALSRVKDLNKLYLKDYNPNAIKTNPKVIEYYKSLG